LKRNNDFREIIDRVKLQLPVQAHEPTPWGILQHDYVFWCGDLNYRITSLPGPAVKELLALEKYEALVPIDQLAEERGAGNVFNGFSEAEIKFAPTYKYVPGTDSLENKKFQTPAWCDRVLYKGTAEGAVTPLQYESVPEMRLSDHKPIRAVLEFPVRIVNAERQAVVRQEVLRSLDVLENSSRPEIGVSAYEYNFPNLKFMLPQPQKCGVTNSGRAVAKFSLTPQPGDLLQAIPDWLTVTPQTGIIAPGETLELKLIANARGWRCVSGLNASTKVEDYILILRVENGGDIFISITASFIRSSFGMPLEQLVLMHDPAANIPPGPTIVGISPTSTSTRTSTDQPMHLPKELWRLIDHLALNGMGADNLFLLHGRTYQVAAARAGLDHGTGFPEDIDVHSVAEVLVQFIQTLTEPVVPVAQYVLGCGCTPSPPSHHCLYWCFLWHSTYLVVVAPPSPPSHHCLNWCF
jgi:phosphatidylinositol-bisphosphatase